MQQSASNKIWTGALILVAGIIVTVFSMMMSRGSGIVVIAWGAMLFGGFRILSGLFHLGSD